MSKLRGVSVRFPTSINQTFDYVVPTGDDPKVGDLVVTSTNLPTLDESLEMCEYMHSRILGDAKIGTVVAVHEVPQPKATKLYLQLVSAANVTQRQAENKLLVEKAKKKENARKKLDTMLRSQEAFALYARMAETNPEAAELLAILKED